MKLEEEGLSEEDYLLIRKALIRQGYLIPTSAEEVAIFEEEFEGKMEDVPEAFILTNKVWQRRKAINTSPKVIQAIVIRKLAKSVLKDLTKERKLKSIKRSGNTQYQYFVSIVRNTYKLSFSKRVNRLIEMANPTREEKQKRREIYSYYFN